MRDAYGGIVNITIIVVFLVIVSGYLAFNVNYTKAFRLKNKIISVLEEYEGSGYRNSQSTARTKIREYASQIGYNTNKPKVDGTGWVQDDVGYCIRFIEKTGSSDSIVNEQTVGKKRGYFEVVTQININIPIINNIMGLSIFQVSGSTNTMDAVL